MPTPIWQRRRSGLLRGSSVLPNSDAIGITWGIGQQSVGVAGIRLQAPVDAAWLDWRGHVGPEHLAALDAAFETVTAPASSRTSRNAGDGPPRAAAERRRP